MRNIKLTIQYDGTNYCGWQRQENGISIQEKIESALGKFLRHKVAITGSGRTDSGVHAAGQIANFKTASTLHAVKISKALNANLPEDIAVTKAEDVDLNFNAQKDASSKIYRYTVFTGDKCSPFDKKHVCHYNFKLNFAAMKKAAALITGRHNFLSFMGANGCAKTFVRTVKSVKLRRKDEYVYITVEADGFLYNMVRVIAGTLLEVGRGKIAPGEVGQILKSKTRVAAGPTMCAKGLTLLKVYYHKNVR